MTEATPMMLMLAIATWAGWLIAKLSPDTFLGRACQDALIDRPAAWAGSLTLRRAASLVLTGAVLTVAVAYLAPIISGEAALVLAGDALAYVEVLTAVVLVSVRSGMASSMVRQKVGAARSRLLAICRPQVRTRAIRSSKRSSRIFPPADDYDPSFALA